MSIFVINEVISDLIENGISLETPLLKLQYFAQISDNDELLNYVMAELNGYINDKNLPSYRKASSIIEVDFMFGEVQHTKEFPIQMLDKRYQNVLKDFYISDSVSVLEEFKTKNGEQGKSEFIVRNVPMGMLHLFQDATAKIYLNPVYEANVVGARLMTNKNVIIKALTSIRSGLLSFCIQIAKTFGENIQIETFKSNTINKHQIINIMNTTINNQGDGNFVNTGSQSQVHVEIQVNKGDKKELISKLKNLGIENDDIDELGQILDEEKPENDEKQLGDKTIGWITKISAKALKGIGKIATEVSSSLLAKLILQYHGIS